VTQTMSMVLVDKACHDAHRRAMRQESLTTPALPVLFLPQTFQVAKKKKRGKVTTLKKKRSEKVAGDVVSNSLKQTRLRFCLST
jgi:hypothetical protein